MAGGRPSKYNPETHLVIIQALARRGLTLPQLAETLSVGPATVSRWMADDETFREAIKEARDIADENVEASLYQRATGYSHKAVKIFLPAGKTTPVYAPYIEHFPPDTGAMAFWLKNRKPKEWRDAIANAGFEPKLVFNPPSPDPIASGLADGTVEIQE